MTPHLQRLLYWKGYEGAVQLWRVVEQVNDGDAVKIEPDRARKSAGYLIVNRSVLLP